MSEQQLEFLLQPGLTSRKGLWQLLEIYLTARRMTLEQFRRRHRLDRTFLKKLEAGTLPDTDPGVVKVRRIVGYGPDLRHRRKAIGVAMRVVEKATGIPEDPADRKPATTPPVTDLLADSFPLIPGEAEWLIELLGSDLMESLYDRP